MSAEKYGRYKAEVEERIERRELLAPRTKVKSEKDVRDIREIKRRDRNENVLLIARPNGLRENANSTISCR